MNAIVWAVNIFQNDLLFAVIRYVANNRNGEAKSSIINMIAVLFNCQRKYTA